MRTDQEWSRFSRYLIRTCEKARDVVVNDLDKLNHSLLHVSQKTQLSLRDLSKGGKNVAAMLEDVDRTANHCVDSVRSLIFTIKPQSLRDLGLVPAIKELFYHIGKEKHVITRVSAEEDWRLDPERETVLFRVLERLSEVVCSNRTLKGIDLSLSNDRGDIKIHLVFRGKLDKPFVETEALTVWASRLLLALISGRLLITPVEGRMWIMTLFIPVEPSDPGEKKGRVKL